jgi:hypothetical protein
MTPPGGPAGPRAWLPAAARLERAAAQAAAQASTARGAGSADPPARSQDVELSAGAVRLAGYLTVPDNPRGIVPARVLRP